MKKAILFAGFFFLAVPAAFPSEESEKMCACLKRVLKSPGHGRVCLELQEAIVKKLGEGSPAHQQFKRDTAACERKLSEATAAPSSPPESKEEKIKAICACSAASKSDKNARRRCFFLQDRYAKTFSDADERRDFLNRTNSCF